MSLEICTIAVTPLQQNCYVIYSAAGGDAAVVDPGGDVDKIVEALMLRGVKCNQIWLTHSHFDHCGGVAGLQRATKAPLFAHPAEAEFRCGVTEICQMFGVAPGDMQACPEPDHPISGGEVLSVGPYEFRALYTPGHAPGHLCFACDGEELVFTGDLVFAGSVGRTDLPGGSWALLMRSIREQILTLTPGTRIFPGHGPPSTVEREQSSNPYLKGEEHG